MKGSNGTNPAAGRRHLGAREHARLQEDITETLCRALRGDERVIVMARLLSEIHNDFRAIESNARSANVRASSAIYEPPTVASMELCFA